MNRIMCFMNKIVWYFKGVRSDGHAWNILTRVPLSVECDRCGKIEHDYLEGVDA